MLNKLARINVSESSIRFQFGKEIYRTLYCIFHIHLWLQIDKEMKNLVLFTEEEFNELKAKLDLLIEFSRCQIGIKEKEWLSNEDVMKLLHIGKSTLQNYRNCGKIKFSQVGRKIIYNYSDIKLFLEKNKI